ncbi:MAG: SLBB domain-containing protein [Bacteroidetes bacterium]|nr:SLBB domain-containing protein [Fibrella sp.]
MQNYRNIHLFLVKSLQKASRSICQTLTVHFLVAGLLLTTELTQAQIAPSSPSAPAGLPSSLPGSPTLPGNAQPGRGNLPANIPGQVPGRPGANQPGRPGQPNANQPGQNNGRTQTPTGNNGRTQTQPGQPNQTGRTQAQPGQPDGQTGTGVDNDLRNSGLSEEQEQQLDDTQKNNAETGYEAARRAERLEILRKLFGNSLFNDPNQAPTFQPNLRIATPRNYIIGPDDQLNINIYGYSEYEYKQSVTPEGNIYFDRGIGPVSVGGLTIEAAKARIVNRLSKIYVGLKSSSYGPQNTYLEVTLGNIRSIRVSVLGEAIRPGTYTLSSLSTAFNAIYQAGGPNELGSFRNVSVIRNNRVIASIDLYDYLLTSTRSNDVRLQDNDNIRFNTYQTRVEISGPVKRNNIFELTKGETLDKLLYFSGGFAATAYKSLVKVTRLTDRERKIIDVTAAEYKTFAIQDGDLVSVEALLDRVENQVTIQGAIYRPGQYSLDRSKTLKQLIEAADGLKGDAFSGRVMILRTRLDMATENLSIDLAAILNGTKEDVPLQREDVITVPSRFELAEQATVSIQGEVNYPVSPTPYMANMTLEDLILKSGGLKESAEAAQVEVVRRKKDVDVKSTTAATAERFIFNVNRDLSIGDGNSKFVLQPFDEVIIRRSPNYLAQTYAGVEGEVVIPGRYAIASKDQKISDMVTLAGGLTPQAYVEGATLVRLVKLSPEELAQQQQSINELAGDLRKATVQIDPTVTNKEESIGIDLKRILANPGSMEDMLVQQDDVLRIPKRLETVRIQGEILLPKTVKFQNGQTFQDYISQAGGFTTKSLKKRAFIVYANGSVDRTRRFAFFNVYPRVEPGAEIVVPTESRTPITPQQALQSATGVVSSLLTLILSVLAFQTLNRP